MRPVTVVAVRSTGLAVFICHLGATSALPQYKRRDGAPPGARPRRFRRPVLCPCRMYQPPHFREDRIEVQAELIRRHPLGLLVTAGPGGLMANPIPFLFYGDDPARPVLRAHL